MADSTQRVRLGFGRVTLPSQSATVTALRVRPSFLKDSAVDSGRREVNSRVYHPASRFPKINGGMWHDYVTHPNGTIIMLQASATWSGRRIRDGAILLRLRQEAAMLNVVATLPIGRESVLGDSFSVFQGHADILSPDEAAVFQVAVPNNFIDNFFDPEEVDECFTIEQIIPARTERPEVALVSTSNGLVIKEVKAAPSRRMKFRKNTP